MTYRTHLLAASHLLVLLLSYSAARATKPAAAKTPEEVPAHTKSANRSNRTSSNDGPELLAAFRIGLESRENRYQELRKTLPLAGDPGKAAMLAYDRMREKNGQPEAGEAFSILQARLYQWLMADPSGAVLALCREMEHPELRPDLPAIIRVQVLEDVIKDQGVLQSARWITTLPGAMAGFRSALVSEMKGGAGFSLFLKVDGHMRSAGVDWHDSQGIEDSADFLRSAGAGARFAEKERLLEFALGLNDADRGAEMLAGFASTGQAASSWILGLIERGGLPENIAKNLKTGVGTEVLNHPLMDLDQRIAARRFTPGNERKTRDAIVGELVGNDVIHLLGKGRDWRFEFRHGTASLEEIVGTMDAALKTPEEGKQQARIALYRQLSEENPDKALPLLADLPEEKKREVLFSNTWDNYANVNPDEFMRFLATLPEPVTQKEKDERMKGWEWKARGNLARYGDDYVEWVAALPSSPDKYAAINSLIWATRERNSARAAELNNRFYPKKP